MPPLYKRISSNLIEALKARDEVRVGVLRMLKAAAKNVAIEKHIAETELGDDEMLVLIGREVKRRKEAALLYARGGRRDLQSKEEAEVKALETYLPRQMNEREIHKVISEVLIGEPALLDSAGRAVGAVMGRVKGRVDGATVKRLVEKAISERIANRISSKGLFT